MNTSKRIPLLLQVNAAGLPVEWINWRHAVCLHVAGKVMWEAGDTSYDVHGGTCRMTGERSVVTLRSVIAVPDRSNKWSGGVPTLTRRHLYQRDRGLCLYCGEGVSYREMEMEHIVPRSKGGRTLWDNVVSACRPCNQRKMNKTPEQAGMQLLAVPYAPNFAEYLLLSNRRVLADQMAFLEQHVRPTLLS